MEKPDVSPVQWPAKTVNRKQRYIDVTSKFRIGHAAALLWLVFSIVVSVPWLNDLGSHIGIPLALILIAGIGYIPGYINMFIAVSLVFDRQPPFKTADPADPVTILIACRWARGMIEALKLFKPWQQPVKYVKYLTGINLI
ncbi:MAG: hypothetical protein WBH87_06700, partial [Acetivibrionales bacterium]